MKIPFFNSNSKTGIRLNRRLVTFLFCVMISTLFWLLLELSKEYTIELKFPVSYINSPADKVIANPLPATIDIEITSRGFNLLIYKLKHTKEAVLIDLKDAKAMSEKNQYYLSTNSRIDKLTSQFSNDTKVLKVYPDTIFLNFNKKITKRVPVKANLKLAFDNNFQQTDSIKLIPDSIRISGAADVVDKINYVTTEPMQLKSVHDSLSLKLSILKSNNLKFVDVLQPTVQAIVNVAKYTEGSIELPIEIENLPLNYSLKIFPDKVVVKYQVAFQNYEKIESIQFRAVVDYAKIERGSTKLKVQLLKYPAEVRSVRIHPEKVEYIIRK
jgi:YbbR domain-containing protein